MNRAVAGVLLVAVLVLGMTAAVLGSFYLVAQGQISKTIKRAETMVRGAIIDAERERQYREQNEQE